MMYHSEDSGQAYERRVCQLLEQQESHLSTLSGMVSLVLVASLIAVMLLGFMAVAGIKRADKLDRQVDRLVTVIAPMPAKPVHRK